jgi:hypothetical protein
MLTTQLYNIGLKLANKVMKNDFLAKEALHNALISCHTNNNWHKPFVMKVIYNECQDIHSRGYYGKSGERRLEKTNNMISTSDESLDILDSLNVNKDILNIDDNIYYRNSIILVYKFLTNKQKKVFISFMSSSNHVSGSKDLKINENTYKTHLKNVLSIFDYYGKNNKLPDTNNVYQKKYIK